MNLRFDKFYRKYEGQILPNSGGSYVVFSNFYRSSKLNRDDTSKWRVRWADYDYRHFLVLDNLLGHFGSIFWSRCGGEPNAPYTTFKATRPYKGVGPIRPPPYLDQNSTKSTPKNFSKLITVQNRNQLIEPVILMYQTRFLIFLFFCRIFFSMSFIYFLFFIY